MLLKVSRLGLSHALYLKADLTSLAKPLRSWVVTSGMHFISDRIKTIHGGTDGLHLLTAQECFWLVIYSVVIMLVRIKSEARERCQVFGKETCINYEAPPTKWIKTFSLKLKMIVPATKRNMV